MRVIVCAILLCAMLQACGSKGALIMPPMPDSQQQPDGSKRR
jgi:predicted small lipoprotein YifL